MHHQSVATHASCEGIGKSLYMPVIKPQFDKFLTGSYVPATNVTISSSSRHQEDGTQDHSCGFLISNFPIQGQVVRWGPTLQGTP